MEEWDDETHDLQVLEDLLSNSADAGNPIEIVTSAFTITEVAYLEAEKAQLAASDSAWEAIRDFWDERVILPVELHERIAMDAREIVRESKFGQWTVKPKDAVHLATAQRLGCRAFHTYDKGLLACDGRFPFPITVPDLLLAAKVTIPGEEPEQSEFEFPPPDELIDEETQAIPAPPAQE